MPPKPDNKNKKNIKNKPNSKKKQNVYEVDPVQILVNVLAILIGGSILIGLIYLFFKTYNPKQRYFVNKANYAYKTIQKELVSYYKERGYVYTSKDEKVDEFCLLIGKKFSGKSPDCKNDNGMMKTNFKFKGTKIEIMGMEKPPFEAGGTLAKDIMIDVNGADRGENELGIDRVPVRLFSTERMGGLMAPLNCSHTDMMELGIEYAPICNNGAEIDFMTTKIPFGYDIFQIGGPKGETKTINRDVPYLRADCTAFGGDMAGLDEYCDAKGFYWNKECYDEFECAVWISKVKM